MCTFHRSWHPAGTQRVMNDSSQPGGRRLLQAHPGPPALGRSHGTGSREAGRLGRGRTCRAGMRTQFTRYGLLVSSRDTKVRSWCLLLILSLSSEWVEGTAQLPRLPHPSCPSGCLPHPGHSHIHTKNKRTCVTIKCLWLILKYFARLDVILAIQ